MRKPTPLKNWPDSWTTSFEYDLLEVFGAPGKHLGYAYAYTARKLQILRMVARVLSPGARILDLAAAQGNFSLLLAEAGYEVTWNDLRTDLVEYVESKREWGTIHYLPGNIFDLDCYDGYDAVLMTEVIEHVAHPDLLLQKVATLVKPRGYIIGSTPNGEYFRNRLPKFSTCPDPSVFESMQFKPDADGHIFLLHKEELEQLAAKAALNVIEIRCFTNPLTNGHIKTAAILSTVPKSLIDALERLTSSMPGPIQRRLHTATAFTFQRK